MNLLSNIFIYHIRMLVVGILCIGGMVSFGIIYTALSSPSIPIPSLPMDGGSVTAATDRFERVFTWAKDKEREKNSVPKVPNSVFFIPPSL